MADPLSIAASIIAVLQLTGTVIGYINDTKDAGEERKRILNETKNIHYLLYLLKDNVERPQWDDTWLETMRSFSAPEGPLEQFKLELERLASKLKPTAGLKKIGKALTWPFQKEEVKDILAGIERQKSLFGLALQNDHMQGSTRL